MIVLTVVHFRRSMGNRFVQETMNEVALSNNSVLQQCPSAPPSCEVIGDHLFLRKYQVRLFERMMNEKIGIKFKKTHMTEVQALIQMKKLLALPEFHRERIYYFGSDLVD